MHSIEGHNFIVGPLEEVILPEGHELSKTYIVHPNKLSRYKEVIK